MKAKIIALKQALKWAHILLIFSDLHEKLFYPVKSLGKKMPNPKSTYLHT